METADVKKYSKILMKLGNIHQWEFIFTDSEMDRIARFCADSLGEGRNVAILRMLFEDVDDKFMVPAYIWVRIMMADDGNIEEVHLSIPVNDKNSLETPEVIKDEPFLPLEERAWRADSF